MTKRSGRNLTDAERARNRWGRITLRLPAETLTLLAILAELNGTTRAKYLAELIDCADMDHARKQAEK